jgi:AcrR family transcriptional regulator
MNDAGGDRCPGAAKGGGRGRNAAATREAILEAARHCFMAEGYDQIGVREIAARVGVDPALVNRYFGSKEALFTEAVATKFDLSALFAGDRATLGERLARYVVKGPGMETPEEGGYDPLVALLRSASSEVAGRRLREALVEGFVRPLSARLDGTDAVLRAELIGSTLLGLLAYRTVIGAMGDGDRERVVAIVAPMLQSLIVGSAPPRMSGGEGSA